MRTDSHGARRRRAFLTFLGLALGVVVLLLLLGALPTHRWGGEGALESMLVGLAISWLAAVAGSLPLLPVLGGAPKAAVRAFVGSVALRLAVVSVLGIAATASGRFHSGALVAWIVIGYSALLVPEGRFTRAVLAGSEA